MRYNCILIKSKIEFFWSKICGDYSDLKEEHIREISGCPSKFYCDSKGF